MSTKMLSDASFPTSRIVVQFEMMEFFIEAPLISRTPVLLSRIVQRSIRPVSMLTPAVFAPRPTIRQLTRLPEAPLLNSTCVPLLSMILLLYIACANPLKIAPAG